MVVHSILNVWPKYYLIYKIVVELNEIRLLLQFNLE